MALSRFPRLLLMLALMAIFLRALVPAGYMPDMHRADGFAMTICTMDGPQKIFVKNTDAPQSEHESVAKHCDFSLLSHTPYNAAAVVAFALAAPFEKMTSAQFVLNDIVHPVFVHAQARPRAPPVLV